MSSNRQRYMIVLSKWPVAFRKKEFDYAYRLRELLKNKGPSEEIFPGSVEDNSRKINALMRLVHNATKNKFFSSATKGACGIDKNELKDLIEQKFNSQNSKKTSFWPID